jgi:hypothetical protein
MEWKRNWPSVATPRRLLSASSDCWVTLRNVRAYPQKVVGLSKLTAPGSVVPEKLEKLCLAAAENHRLHKELVCADCLRLRRRRPKTPGL